MSTVFGRENMFILNVWLFHSFPSIMNEDTVNMIIGTSKGSDLLNIVDEVLY